MTRPGDGIDAFVQQEVAATNGLLYREVIGRLREYPIPEIRLPVVPTSSQRLIDIGCNWGRWSISAARKGYAVVALDPNLQAVLAARRVANQLGVSTTLIVGDARRLPIASGALDVAFSYSVLQHFSKPDVHVTLEQIARVVRAGGRSLVQMPNKLGVRNVQQQVLAFFRGEKQFDVRYWSPGELLRTFDRTVGPSTLSVDGYFGLGIGATDSRFVPPKYRILIQVSHLLARASERAPLQGLRYVADSLYVASRVEPRTSVRTMR